MKKIIALIIILVLAITLVSACGKKEQKEEPTSIEEIETETEPETPTVPTDNIGFDSSWQYGSLAEITSGQAVLYHAENGNGIVVSLNAGHGTKGGEDKKIPCHPDYSGKFTGDVSGAGSVFAVASSQGMVFHDGTAEADVNLLEAKILRNKLLKEGFDVLMIRDGEDVQLDNVARTLIANNVADINIAIHWDGDGLKYDKGCFFASIPNEIKRMSPVIWNWENCDALGTSLIEGLRAKGIKIYQEGFEPVDLVITSYSTIPATEIELGNSASDHSMKTLSNLADGLVIGIKQFFENR